MTPENGWPFFDSIWCINGGSYGSLGAGASNSTTRTNPHFKHRSVVCNPVVRVSYGDSSLLLALFESLDWVKNVRVKLFTDSNTSLCTSISQHFFFTYIVAGAYK